MKLEIFELFPSRPHILIENVLGQFYSEAIIATHIKVIFIGRVLLGIFFVHRKLTIRSQDKEINLFPKAQWQARQPIPNYRG